MAKHYRETPKYNLILGVDVMAKAYWGEIKDPVHGYVYVTENEKKIIDSYPMQRLRRLRQLAGSEYVYPGANHTRFEHCVGVMFLAGKVAENPHVSQSVNDEEADMIRLSGLLHDVGHGPFSHVFEQLLIKNNAHLIIDSEATVIACSRDGRQLSIESSHELFEQNPQLVATGRGIESLDGRSRDKVLSE